MTRKRPPGEGRLLQLVYYGYVAGSKLAAWLPERAAYGLANLIGSIAARRGRGKNGQLERNLARITGLPLGSPELFALVAEAQRSYCRYWLETFRAVRESAEFFLERMTHEGADKIQEMLDRGKGAVVLIGHCGNWDAAGAWAGAKGWRVHTVAEKLRPQRMFDFFVAHRERLGLEIYPAQTGVTRKLADAVAAGAVVPLLGDRDLKGTGVVLDFFGEPATFPRGTAALAVRTGVPILFAGIRGKRHENGKWGWHIEVSGPIEVPENAGDDAVDELTAAAIRLLEDFIRRYPTEWHVFQPFWLADRELT